MGKLDDNLRKRIQDSIMSNDSSSTVANRLKETRVPAQQVPGKSHQEDIDVDYELEDEEDMSLVAEDIQLVEAMDEAYNAGYLASLRGQDLALVEKTPEMFHSSWIEGFNQGTEQINLSHVLSAAHDLVNSRSAEGIDAAFATLEEAMKLIDMEAVEAFWDEVEDIRSGGPMRVTYQGSDE